MQTRQSIWNTIQTTEQWDIVIIGGGITGAGILREAVRAGLQVLLIEQRDFAWGTSSRSSKLVHGGLRYLKQGQIGLTYQSVKERQNLLKAGRGLISPLGFMMPIHKSDSKLTYQLGLTLYDLMALRRNHKQYDLNEFLWRVPHMNRENLEGGFYFEDAQTDDARLVFRIIQEAVASGGTAVNYVRASQLCKQDEQVCGVQVEDILTGQMHDIKASVVINATGAHVDFLRGQAGKAPVIRPLRGSHLLFPAWRFPLAQAVSFPHPEDGRPVFAYPWEGVTLVGTTDLDHQDNLNTEPRIAREEVAYLLAACNHHFPSLNLAAEDVLSTYAGVRPVIGTGKADPSKESREHVVWLEAGLLSVTGGKLTTFRLIALDVLEEVAHLLREKFEPDHNAPALEIFKGDLPEIANQLTEAQRWRLIGRYGAAVVDILKDTQPDDLQPVGNTNILALEIRYAARYELVAHLDDLLLRRTRLGLITEQGGLPCMETIRKLCQAELGWDDDRWQSEVEAYTRLWQESYSLPNNIPDWRTRIPETESHSASRTWRYAVAAAVSVAAVYYSLRRDTA